MLNTILGFLAGLLIGGVVCSTGVASPVIEQGSDRHMGTIHHISQDRLHIASLNLPPTSGICDNPIANGVTR